LREQQIEELARAIVEGMVALEVEQYCQGIINEMTMKMQTSDIRKAEKIAMDRLNSQMSGKVDLKKNIVIH
jgi:hypothetical protein